MSDNNPLTNFISDLSGTVFVPEITRLNEKKQSIETAIEGQKRMIHLNDSYQKKTGEYTNMVILFAVVLFICLAIITIQRNFPAILSDAMSSLLIVIIMALGVLYASNIYIGILERNPTDFDKLNIPPPPNVEAPAGTSGVEIGKKTGNLFGQLNLGGCIGQNCCADGTVWDASLSSCIPVYTYSTTVPTGGSAVYQPQTVLPTGTHLYQVNTNTAPIIQQGFTTLFNANEEEKKALLPEETNLYSLYR